MCHYVLATEPDLSSVCTFSWTRVSIHKSDFREYPPTLLSLPDSSAPIFIPVSHLEPVCKIWLTFFCAADMCLKKEFVAACQCFSYNISKCEVISITGVVKINNIH